MKSTIHNFRTGKNNNRFKNKIFTLTALLSFMAAVSWGQTIPSLINPLVPQNFTFIASLTANGLPAYYAGYDVRVEIRNNNVTRYEETHQIGSTSISQNQISVNVGTGTWIIGSPPVTFPQAMHESGTKTVRVTIYPISFTAGLGSITIERPLSSVPTSMRSAIADSIPYVQLSSGNVSVAPTAALTVRSGTLNVGTSSLVSSPGTLTLNGGSTFVTTGGVTLSNSNATTDGTLRFISGDLQVRSGGVWQTVSTSGGASSPWTTTGANIINSNTGNVGIGALTPVAKLEVNGPIKIGGFGQGNYPQTPGMMRFQNGVFEGFTGQAWVPFGGGGAAPTLSVNGNLLSISGGNTVTLPSLTPWSTVGNDIYNNNSGKVMIATVNSTRPEKFQFIDETTGAYQNSAKFIRTNPYGSTLLVIDSGISGTPDYNMAVSAKSVYGSALHGTSTRGYGVYAKGGGSFYPAALIEANAGAAGLVVSNSSTTSAPQLNIEETTGGNYARLKFTNFSNPTNSWTVAGLNTATTANDRLNFNHNVAGDVLSITGDGKTLIKGATAFNNSFGTTGQVLQSNGNNAAPTWVTPAVPQSLYDNMSTTITTQTVSALTVTGAMGYVLVPGLTKTFTLTGNAKAVISGCVYLNGPFCSLCSNYGNVTIWVDGNIVFSSSDEIQSEQARTIVFNKSISLGAGTHTVDIKVATAPGQSIDVMYFASNPWATAYMDMAIINQ